MSKDNSSLAFVCSLFSNNRLGQNHRSIIIKIQNLTLEIHLGICTFSKIPGHFANHRSFFCVSSLSNIFLDEMVGEVEKCVPLAQVWTTTKLASGIHFWCLTLEWWPRLFVGVDTLLPKCTKVQLLLLTSGRAPYVIPLFFSQLLFQACLLQLGASNLGPKKLCKLLGCYSFFLSSFF